MASRRPCLLLSQCFRIPTSQILPQTTLPRALPRSTKPPPLPVSVYRCQSLRPYSIRPPQQKEYTFEDVKSLSAKPSAARIIIDVREPSELSSTGRIPGAKSMPLTSHPDAVYLSPAAFVERFGFAKPGGAAVSSAHPAPHAAGHGGADVAAAAAAENDDGKGELEVEVEEGQEVREVVFYCKAGVRSKAAMKMASGEGGWDGVSVGHWGGGWDEWEKRGGEVER